MAQFDIPTFPEPFWVQTTSLDGVPYQLWFAYSQRERVYYLTIGDSDGQHLASGDEPVTFGNARGTRLARQGDSGWTPWGAP